MPLDQIALPFMAVLMFIAALMGTTALGGQGMEGVTRASVGQLPTEASMIDCRILRIDVKEFELVGVVKEIETTFKVAPAAQVTKDGKPVRFGSLAEGDFAVLSLAQPGSTVVTRIDAVSSR